MSLILLCYYYIIVSYVFQLLSICFLFCVVPVRVVYRISVLTGRPRFNSSASNYTHERTYREGHGSGASNYTHETTYPEPGHGYYPTGHELPASYPRHQPRQTRGSEPHELDSNQGYGVASGQNHYGQGASRAPTSPTFNRGGRDHISTPPSRGGVSSDYPVPAPIIQPSVSIRLL